MGLSENVTIAHHSNLRDETYKKFDNVNVKHITRDEIPKYASDLKRALRTVHGINEFYRDFRKPGYGRNHDQSDYMHQNYNRTNNFSNCDVFLYISP